MPQPDQRPLSEVLDAAGWPDPTRDPSDPSIPNSQLARTLKLLRFLVREVKPYKALFAFHSKRVELTRAFAELVKLERDLNDELIRRESAAAAARIEKLGGAA